MIECKKIDSNVNVFNIYKEYMKPWVSESFGWDDEFQIKGFAENMDKRDFKWIFINNIKVGIVCLKEDKEKVNISLLVIFKEFQNKGYGFECLNHIIGSAPTFKKITWNCLKCNLPAISLYSKLTDVEVNDSTFFYHYIVVKR